MIQADHPKASSEGRVIPTCKSERNGAIGVKARFMGEQSVRILKEHKESGKPEWAGMETMYGGQGACQRLVAVDVPSVGRMPELNQHWLKIIQKQRGSLGDSSITGAGGIFHFITGRDRGICAESFK